MFFLFFFSFLYYQDCHSNITEITRGKEAMLKMIGNVTDDVWRSWQVVPLKMSRRLPYCATRLKLQLRFHLKKGVNNVFSYQFGIFRIRCLSWMSCTETLYLFSVCLVFLGFFFLHLLPMRTMLEHCSAPEIFRGLSNYFFISMWGRHIFFRLTAPLISFLDITGDPHTNTDLTITKVPSLHWDDI